MILDEFNKLYKYKTDLELWGFKEVWEVIKKSDDGFYYGDCESYLLTIKKEVPEFKKLELYYCKLNGVGHAVGFIDNKYIDCNFKKLVNSLPGTYTDVKKYSILMILIKRFSAKVLKIIKRLKEW